MSIVSFIAVLTNAIIIAFHSVWMENQFKKYTDDENRLLVAKLGFVLAFEVNYKIWFIVSFKLYILLI